jgi:hypothetical protein
VIGPLVTKPSRWQLIFWAVLASLNLVAGVMISSQPERLTDFESMHRWGRSWLLEGESLYRLPEWAVDYPPNAIVLLSPLGLLSLDGANAAWLMLNAASVVLAPYCAARFFRPHDPFRVILLPILMFLCWGGVRTLMQFSLVALASSMMALMFADRSRMLAGVSLGFAMLKPQVAVPVLLWSLFARRWRVALAAVTTVAALFAIFCLRTSTSPVSLVGRYASILAMFYTGDAILSGLSDLRPLISQHTGAPSDTDAIAASISLGLVAAICVFGFQEGRFRSRALYAAPPLAACWSLLTFYHLTYGFIILLPVMMLLALNDTEQSRLRKGLFWLLQLGMMFDVPGLSRRAGLGDTRLYTNILWHADRVLILTLFVGLIVLAWREPVTE